MGYGVADTLSRAFAVVLLKIVGYIVRHVQRSRAPLVAVGIVRLEREAATSQAKLESYALPVVSIVVPFW